MEKLAILAFFVLMLSTPTLARMPTKSNTIAMVTNGDNNNNEEHKTKNEPILVMEEIMVMEEPYNSEVAEQNGGLKCAQVLEDCFRTPCCSGLRCDLGIHARCV
ncbi:hypothetical protein RND81_14G174800 [Saponaria officinalis]|uniref:Uncharacterized protein n=1 Tax=Saponaria officinalis TaxID=3572 RepID=A0AAW1GXD7_SAPOF